MMLSENLLTIEQQLAIGRMYDEDYTVLIAATGAGKTATCLTAINELLEDGVLRRIIVAVPAKVLETMVWPNEATKWEHLRGLVILQLSGTSAQRTKQLLSCPSDIIVVSLGNLDWLLDQDHECDGIIIDEISKAAGKQTAGLRKKKSKGLKWRVGLSATPVSQSFEKLYAICRIIDGGASLGTNKEKYLNQYFYTDYNGFNYTLRDGADAMIMARVRGLVHAIEDDKAETLPPLHHHVVEFDMPEQTREVYDEMRQDMFIEEAGVEAANEAVKSGKLRQLASGFAYDNDGEIVAYDDRRVFYAKTWVNLLPIGAKCIIFYEFEAQKRMLLETMPWANETVDGFVNNDSPNGAALIAQINSLSHGIDGLQNVCSDMLFLHPMWSRDQQQQAEGRLHRTGQQNPVNVTTLVCKNTLDSLVMSRVEDRGQWMKLFMKHLKGK